MLIWDSPRWPILLENSMSKTPPNLADLPPDVQAFVAAQAAELARKDAEILGLSLSHASAQKRLKDEKATAEDLEEWLELQTSFFAPERKIPAKGKKGKASGAAASSPGVPSRREVTAAMNAARLSGKLVLDSLDHSKALEMLRDVENNETALRAKWGLFSPDHPPPQGAEELALSYAERRARGIPADAAVTASGDLIPLGQTNDGPSGAGDAGDVGVESTRTAAVDADTVARVWEARNQYARWQAALDDGVADVSSPNGEGFSPCEVHEEIAERLLDALLADVARELGDACDEATQIVLRHEFSSAANSIDASSVGGDDDDSNILVIADGGTTTPPRNGLGAYDGATPAAMDVTLGAAMARVGLSPEEASAEIVEEEDFGGH